MQRGGRSRGRDKKGRGRRRGRGAGKEEDNDEEEMEVGTRHEELVYWYTSFEDPNCIAVVELVATIMDNTNGIQVRAILATREANECKGIMICDNKGPFATLDVPHLTRSTIVDLTLLRAAGSLISLSRQQCRRKR